MCFGILFKTKCVPSCVLLYGAEKVSMCFFFIFMIIIHSPSCHSALNMLPSCGCLTIILVSTLIHTDFSFKWRMFCKIVSLWKSNRHFLKDVRKYVGVSYEHCFKEIKTNPHDHCDQCAYSAKALIATVLHQTGRKSAMLKELKQTQQEETL